MHHKLKWNANNYSTNSFKIYKCISRIQCDLAMSKTKKVTYRRQAQAWSHDKALKSHTHIYIVAFGSTFKQNAFSCLTKQCQCPSIQEPFIILIPWVLPTRRKKNHNCGCLKLWLCFNQWWAQIICFQMKSNQIKHTGSHWIKSGSVKKKLNQITNIEKKSNQIK